MFLALGDWDGKDIVRPDYGSINPPVKAKLIEISSYFGSNLDEIARITQLIMRAFGWSSWDADDEVKCRVRPRRPKMAG